MSRPHGGRRLQLTGYKASNYQRPNDRWSCGRNAEGHPCSFGPSSGGGCGAVCTPWVRRDGGAECGMPAGERCTEGPAGERGSWSCSQVACQPAPSTRRLRGLANLSAVLVTLGALALGLSHPATRDAISNPGPLSNHHAALACADCHTAAVKSETASWTAAAIGNHGGVDSAKCRACHQLSEGDNAWHRAHTLQAATLAALQSDARGRVQSGRRPPGVLQRGADLLQQAYGIESAETGYAIEHEVECALCHSEHHGRSAPVREAPEHRCQVCHTARFESFEAGHPEFYSFGQRQLASNPVFTHVQHYGSYFGSESLACAACHRADERGRHMVLQEDVFEQVCLRCHQHRVNLEPLPLIQTLPGPARAWLSDLEARPAGLDELPEIEPTELTRLLLPDAEHKQAERALKILRKRFRSLIRKAPEDKDGDGRFSVGDGLKSRDLKKLAKNKEDAELAGAYGKRTEQLLDALIAGEVESLREVLALPPQASLADLRRALPVAALKQFRKAWFDPKGSSSDRELSVDASTSLSDGWKGGGRYVASDERGGLSYRDYTHRDPLLKALLGLAPQAGRPEQQEAMFALFAERCGKCHVDPSRPAASRVQWKAALDPPETARRLTFFAHEPHVEFESDCRGCHVMRAEPPASRSLSDFEISPAWRTRGLRNQAGCLQCHTEERYGSGCQTCHDYHAGDQTPNYGSTSRVK
mgnify:CR=1 FL=1